MTWTMSCGEGSLIYGVLENLRVVLESDSKERLASSTEVCMPKVYDERSGL